MAPSTKGLVVFGAASPPGRLFRTLERMRDRMGELEQVECAELLDLSTSPVELCDGRPPDAYDEATRAAVAAAERADLVVLGSPVYRGTFTGVLKNYLDLLPLSSLDGKPVGIVAMGASDHHYLGVDWQLRQVLAWFGALPAPTSAYLSGRSFDEDGKPLDDAVEELGALARTLVRMASHAGPSEPRPLAGGRG